MATIVTSLYDMDRHKIDGRAWEDYLKWFEKTLALKSPMVVFVDQSMRDFVAQNRQDKPTKIFCEPLKNVPFFSYKEKMDEIINSYSFQSRMADTNRIECKDSLYSIIQYSKFYWMEKTCLENPFDSKYFLWMDAGLSRFFDDLDLEKEYPSVKKEDQLVRNRDKILIQVFHLYYPDLFNASTLTEDYFLDNRSFVMGGMFGGGPEAISKLHSLVKNKFEEKIQENVFNNEQIMLGYLYKKYPEIFSPFVHHLGFRNYELINFLNE